VSARRNLPRAKLARMRIRIEGFDLPGRECGAGPDFPGYENIHVGVQRRGKRDELLGLTAGDAPSAEWTLECDATATAEGLDCKGPYVQGRPHERFIYLSWGAVDQDGTFNMFRRAKLMFEGIPAEVLRTATRSKLLVGRLALTDTKGHPLCAAVRPPKIAWSAG
jgi:hypothetical protein